MHKTRMQVTCDLLFCLPMILPVFHASLTVNRCGPTVASRSELYDSKFNFHEGSLSAVHIRAYMYVCPEPNSCCVCDVAFVLLGWASSSTCVDPVMPHRVMCLNLCIIVILCVVKCVQLCGFVCRHCV